MVSALAAIVLSPVADFFGRRQSAAVAFTAAALIVLYGYAVSRGLLFYYRTVDYPVRTARGEIFARRPHGPVFARALERLAQLPGGAELLVLPEEGFINFFAARRSRVRTSTVIPGMLLTPEDERRFVTDLAAQAPDYIIITTRRFREHGTGSLASYNPIVVGWIQQHYGVIDHIQEATYALDIFARERGQAQAGGG